MKAPVLAIVTPDGTAIAERVSAVSAALDAIPAGAALVMLRDKTLAVADLAVHEAALSRACAARGAPLFAPWHAGRDASSSASLHFSDSDAALEAIGRLRARARARPLAISVSIHRPEQAAALATSADLIILGPIWETPLKPRAIGLDAIAEAARLVRGTSARLFAIGGVTSAARVAAALAAGAHGVAGIRSFNGAEIASLLLDSATSACRS